MVGPSAKYMLQAIGEALDEGRPLRVHLNGCVRLDGSGADEQMKEKNDEQQGQGRSPTRSGQRAAGRQRKAGRSREAGSSTRICSREIRLAYDGQIDAVKMAYPSLEAFPDEDGIWLRVRSSLLDGFDGGATFLIGLPHIIGAGPRSWGFWELKDSPDWIGPRHTNFFDGSICAFKLEEGIWTEGGNLATLIDLYSVWAVRQLHLLEFGRWAGQQYSLPYPYYRLVETKPDELCGCGSTTKRYRECCQPTDLRAGNLTALKRQFEQAMGGGIRDRRPPNAVVAFISDAGPLPRIREVHDGLRKAKT